MTVVVVAWILSLMAVFGLNYGADALHESAAVRMEMQRRQLRAWAWSGVELAMVSLEHAPPVDRAMLTLPAADQPLAAVGRCGGGFFAVGAEDDDDGFRQWRPGLRDETARLPVALADSIALSLVPGMTRRGAETLLAARALTGDRRLPPFEALDLDGPSLAAARRYLSRYGAAVNINTAGGEVLRALGLPDGAVQKMLGHRAGRDGIEGTGDDRRFDTLEDDNADVRACGLNSEEAAVLALLSGSRRLGVASRYWTVAATGWGGGLDGVCEIRAVVEMPDREAARVVEWTEHWLD
jgi:hypothetical protein